MKPLALLFLTALLAGACVREARPLPTVARVDLQRYAGRWYEIARLPNSFQRDDSRATAEYTVQPDGRVKVRNTELRPDGTTRVAEGTARVAPGSDGARLRVKFSGLAALAPDPSTGNYWIIHLEPDYSAALVGTPDREFLWLLARDKKLRPATRNHLAQRAQAQGFPIDRLIIADWSR